MLPVQDDTCRIAVAARNRAGAKPVVLHSVISATRAQKETVYGAMASLYGPLLRYCMLGSMRGAAGGRGLALVEALLCGVWWQRREGSHRVDE